MALTVAQLKDELFPWGLRTLTKVNFNHYLDSDLINDINDVQRSLNGMAEIHAERYQNLDITAGTTNLQVQRNILNVLYFKFQTVNANENKAWTDQRYTYVNDVIVLKNATIANDTVDIIYMGDTADIEGADSDEVDLPDWALAIFRRALKEQIKYQVDLIPHEKLEQSMLFFAAQCRDLKPTRLLRVIPTSQNGSWPSWSRSDDLYNITKQWVSQDSVTADWDGDVIFL